MAAHSGVNSLDALKELKGLTNLTLDLRDSRVNDLSVVRDLGGLKELDVFQSQHYELGRLPESVTTLRL